LIQTLEGDSGQVRAMASSPDDKLLASAYDDQTVKLWDAGSGAVLQTLEGYSDQVNTVAFSSEGKLLVSASSDYTVELWDVDSGARLQGFEAETTIETPSISSDGTYVQIDTRQLHTAFFLNSTAIPRPNLLHSIRVEFEISYEEFPAFYRHRQRLKPLFECELGNYAQHSDSNTRRVRSSPAARIPSKSPQEGT
jgi:hypothetical protein